MLKAVIQTCDWCGLEDRSKGMHVPEGWLIVDTRGGKEPGEVGYGWNVCGKDCLLEMLEDWGAGKRPIPYGMSEASQEIHVHEPVPVKKRRRPEEMDADLIANASAVRHRESVPSVPVEEQGYGGH